jgi:trans-aconitate 2-methyltransferase
VLAELWPNAQITGIDSSLEMIVAASTGEPGRRWQVSDIVTWASESADTFDVVFSNAALQWVGNHGSLLVDLFRRVAAGGALAVQMPDNFSAPAHQIMRELAASTEWGKYLPISSVRERHVHDLTFYYNLLVPIVANVDLWATEYVHVMRDAEAIVEWYKGTGLRPFLEALPGDHERTKFSAAYLNRVREAYHPQSDGRILFPFRRLFVIAYRA